MLRKPCLILLLMLPLLAGYALATNGTELTRSATNPICAWTPTMPRSRSHAARAESSR